MLLFLFHPAIRPGILLVDINLSEYKTNRKVARQTPDCIRVKPLGLLCR